MKTRTPTMSLQKLSTRLGAVALAGVTIQLAACGGGSSSVFTPVATPTQSGSTSSTTTSSSSSNTGGSVLTAIAQAFDAAFGSITAAFTDSEKRQVRATNSATINGQTVPTGFNTILRSGDRRGSDASLNTYGLILDNQMKPILASDGSTTISDANDFTSILKVGSKLFSVAHMEDIPGALYLTELSQDKQSGALTAVSTRALDLSGINGIVSPCAGSVTPWQTHLGSEEDAPDARAGRAGYMATYFGGGTTIGGDASKSNLYFWGYPVEVAMDESANATVTKHYSMGRMSHELSYVMPDNRTVYQSDDETNTSYYMYTADKAGDLTAGTLYAIKVNQTTPAGTTDLVDANVSWIKLGHASDSEIKTLIDAGTKFSDIFDTATPDSNAQCATGFKSVNTTYGLECLALKSGKEKAAAFLETRRYAAYLGATMEFRKEEGMTFDPDGKRMYVSYSFLERGMEDNRKLGVANTQYDRGGNNDIKAIFNHCGAVYAYDMGSDTTIGSDYVAKSMHGVLAGIMTTKADPNRLNPRTVDAYPSGPSAGNVCSLDGIANPDNISFMPGQKTLLIGEDSDDGHQNDMTWAYNIETKKLTRIMTTPYGAEVTSLYYHPNINNFSYILNVVQHPYGESDQSMVSPTSAERRSYLGYIGPLPVLKK